MLRVKMIAVCAVVGLAVMLGDAANSRRLMSYFRQF